MGWICHYGEALANILKQIRNVFGDRVDFLFASAIIMYNMYFLQII